MLMFIKEGGRSLSVCSRPSKPVLLIGVPLAGVLCTSSQLLLLVEPLIQEFCPVGVRTCPQLIYGGLILGLQESQF